MLIKISNIINYFFLRVFLFTHKTKNSNGNNLLLIETGGVGDIVISSIVLQDNTFYNKFNKVFFLVKDEFSDLFSDYLGSIKILSVNENKFKYNLFYRLAFIYKLRQLKLHTSVNITSARLMWNETISLCNGATNKITFENDWKHFIKLFQKNIDALYSNRLITPDINEYNKIKYLLERVFLKTPKEGFFLSSGRRNKISYDIVISPFASEIIKTWDLSKFRIVIEMLSKSYRILLVGDNKQEKELKKISLNLVNVKISAGEINLNELYSIIANSKLYIGLDSGITHLALMSSTQVIALIGGGSYRRYLPKADDYKTIYLAKSMDCFGCEWKCSKEENYCLSDISSKEVLLKVDEFLNSNN